MGGNHSKRCETFVFTDEMMKYVVRAAFDVDFIEFMLHELTLDEFKKKFANRIFRHLANFLSCIEPMEGTVPFNDTHEKFFYYAVQEFLRIFHDFEVFMKEQSTNTSGISYVSQVFGKFLEVTVPSVDSSIFQDFARFLDEQSSDRDDVAQAVYEFLRKQVENWKNPSTKSAQKRDYKK